MELAIFVGLPASGKSTFFRRRLAATHRHVSRDLLRDARNPNARQRDLIERALQAGDPVAVDNTNLTAAGRNPLIHLGRAYGARIVGYYFESRPRDALERNRGRQGTDRVPDVAIHAAAKRLEPPSSAEGFDALYRVRICPDLDFEVTAWPGDPA